MKFDEPIVAQATPYGVSAIGIIRLSGNDIFQIVDKFFQPKNGISVQNQKHKTVNLGYIIDENEIVDEVLVTKFKAPHSYTGQDLVEISCHGSPVILNRVVHIALKNGCRSATPGEFTLRAFLNGKIDLSQAEAIADLIASESDAARRVAMQQLRGGFSNELKQLRQQLINFVSLIELELDFSEEDVEFADRKQLLELIDIIIEKLSKLVNSFRYGNAIKNGINVAIVGEPNVGKSTLLNTLLNEDKAIVSEIPGTTRDYIEDTITINGILFRFIDTAGLRHTTDTIEVLGIERSIEMIKRSEIVLYVVDVLALSESHYFEHISEHLKGKKVIIVVNKIDKKSTDIDLSIFRGYPIVEISAKQKINLDKLHKALVEATEQNVYSQEQIVITNIRHYEALKNCLDSALKVREAIESNISPELLTFDIRYMLEQMGEITGEITNDEILGNIFKNFCIGK
ncbi:MAG: tRNA uridine-5-carboxymethylaminomethyl(34) synthesis GTPase MnmE [Candidatus Micrarchaeia archaeon]